MLLLFKISQDSCDKNHHAPLKQDLTRLKTFGFFEYVIITGKKNPCVIWKVRLIQNKILKFKLLLRFEDLI